VELHHQTSTVRLFLRRDLGQEDSRLLTLVEMRFFGGMTAEETADAMGESVNVVRHDLRYAKAWLRRTLGSRPP
jgi:DNA-directed RNA polymerase specialized sigma24 family protein